jgi:hypothetical protein
MATAVSRIVITGGVIGSTGDLQQIARPLHVGPASLLRPDAQVDVHGSSFASKALAASRSPHPHAAHILPRHVQPLLLPPRVRLPPSRSCVPAGLPDPLPRRSPSQVKFFSTWSADLLLCCTNPAIFSLEFRGERTASPGLLSHGLRRGHPSSGRTADGGCPSKRSGPFPLPLCTIPRARSSPAESVNLNEALSVRRPPTPPKLPAGSWINPPDDQPEEKEAAAQ